MPLDLSEYMEKLKSRVAIAEGWLGSLKEVVPCPLDAGGNVDELAWLSDMRIALLDGRYGRLHELASEGSRIPVDVEPLKLLQVELDAKNWSAKAIKWVPIDDGNDGKKGKLEDIREHVYKADLLREKLTLSEAGKKLWVLEGELALKSIVRAADSWLEQVRKVCFDAVDYSTVIPISHIFISDFAEQSILGGRQSKKSTPSTVHFDHQFEKDCRRRMFDPRQHWQRHNKN